MLFSWNSSNLNLIAQFKFCRIVKHKNQKNSSYLFKNILLLTEP